MPPRVVDLTHTLTADFPLFPVYDPIEVCRRFDYPDGFFVQGWRFDEHCGTHVDAPAHFGPGTDTVDRIDPQDLVLPLCVVDVREGVARDEDLVVTPDDVLRWEARHGALPERCLLAARTGWDARVGDAAAYLNVDASGTYHAPGLSEELAGFLLEDRPGVRGVGLDTPSLDRLASTAYGFHTAWLPAGRFGIENLTRLGDVPPSGATVVVGVPPLAGGSGAPARILALV